MPDKAAPFLSSPGLMIRRSRETDRSLRWSCRPALGCEPGLPGQALVKPGDDIVW